MKIYQTNLLGQKNRPSILFPKTLRWCEVWCTYWVFGCSEFYWRSCL